MAQGPVSKEGKEKGKHKTQLQTGVQTSVQTSVQTNVQTSVQTQAPVLPQQFPMGLQHQNSGVDGSLFHPLTLLIHPLIRLLPNFGVSLPTECHKDTALGIAVSDHNVADAANTAVFGVEGVLFFVVFEGLVDRFKIVQLADETCSK